MMTTTFNAPRLFRTFEFYFAVKMLKEFDLIVDEQEIADIIGVSYFVSVDDFIRQHHDIGPLEWKKFKDNYIWPDNVLYLFGYEPYKFWPIEKVKAMLDAIIDAKNAYDRALFVDNYDAPLKP